MTLFDWLGILIGGPLVIAVFYFVVLRGPRKHAEAKKNLARLRDAWGLTLTPSESKNGIGTFAGEQRGHAIRLLPDEASVHVPLRQEPKIQLSTDAGPTEIRFDHAALNGFFRTRYVRGGAISKELESALHAIFHRFETKIAHLRVDRHGITLRAREGDTSDFTYVDASFVREVMPLLLDLAEVLDAEAES